MKNKVKQIRTRQKLSQRELAALAKTSQQQIQRIETGQVTTSLHTARAIAAALQQPFEAVFPDAAKALAGLGTKMRLTKRLRDEDLQEVAQAGVEADTSAWFFKFQLEGAREPRIIQIAPEEKRRLYRAVQEESEPGLSFIVFDSPTHRLAVNLSQLVLCHFLMEPLGAGRHTEDVEGVEPEEVVRLFPTSGGAAIELEVEPDEPDGEDGLGQLGHIFYMLEMEPGASDRYRIVDSDDEDAFVRAGSIACLEVPLDLLTESPADEDEDEDDAE